MKRNENLETMRGLGVDECDGGVCAVLDVDVDDGDDAAVDDVVVVVVEVDVVDAVDDGRYFNCDSATLFRFGECIAFLTSVGANASTTVSNTSEPGNTGFFKYWIFQSRNGEYVVGMIISFFNGTDLAVDTLGDAFFTYNGTDSEGDKLVCSTNRLLWIFVVGVDATE